MLGSYLKLSAYVMGHKLTEERVVAVAKHVVKADSRADEYLLYTGYSLNSAEKLGVFALICHKIFAGTGGKTLSVGTNAMLLLLLTGRVAEVCGGAAYVVDISLEVRHSGDLFSLCNHGFHAS